MRLIKQLRDPFAVFNTFYEDGDEDFGGEIGAAGASQAAAEAQSPWSPCSPVFADDAYDRYFRGLLHFHGLQILPYRRQHFVRRP